MNYKKIRQEQIALLRKFIERHGTQSEAGEKLMASDRTIRRWLTGQSRMKPMVIKKISTK